MTTLQNGLGKYDGVRKQLGRLQTLIQDHGRLTLLLAQVDNVGLSLDNEIPKINAMLDQAAVKDLLKSSDVCVNDPRCASLVTGIDALIGLRDDGLLSELLNLRDTLRAATGKSIVSGMVGTLQQDLLSVEGALDDGGPGLSGIADQFKRLEDGVQAMADGATRLSNGVQLLVDKTRELGSGMKTVADVLGTMGREANTPAMSGFYLPQSVFNNHDFKRLADYTVTPDGKMARYIIQTSLDPYSQEAVDLYQLMSTVARQALPHTTLENATVSIIGLPAANAELHEIFIRDFKWTVVFTLLIVLSILIILLRALVAPIYLLASVVLSYGSALGVGALVFQILLGEKIYWVVPSLAFIILVAVGADYNMLIISRLREESAEDTKEGVSRTVMHTGAVITSAGLIFAAQYVRTARRKHVYSHSNGIYHWMWPVN